MLGDIELFIVTWSLAGFAFISLYIMVYYSTQVFIIRNRKQTEDDDTLTAIQVSEKKALRFRNLSIIALFLITITGTYVSITNWTIINPYTSNTYIFRAFSVQSSLFIGLLVIGILFGFLGPKGFNKSLQK